jgi:tyrosyl-tRNA synthetase
VKNKLEKGDGMSFAEFTYPLLQAWDWWHMYNTMGIRMQIGGSDQYGNITAGIDAVKYVAANHPSPETPKKTKELPFGFTVPLLTTSSGAKFGKSAGNAIWLDEDMTSTFDLYQYFLRTSDDDVERYLKLFTFMPIDKIQELVQKHMEDPSKRIAQHKLASEFVELVHGKKEADSARAQHQLIFQKSPNSEAYPQSLETALGDPVGVRALKFPQVTLNNKPKAQMKLPRSLIEKHSIGRILFACGLADSSSEGHRLASQQAVHIGGKTTGGKQPMADGSLTFVPVKLWAPEETKQFLGDDNLLILRRGKHNIRIIQVVEDEEYKQLGLTYPGMPRDFANQTPDNRSKNPTTEGTGLRASEENTADDTAPEEYSLTEKELEMEDRGEGEVILSYPSPEARIEALQTALARDELSHLRKLAKKNEPKPRFMGHGRPRPPGGGFY